MLKYKKEIRVRFKQEAMTVFSSRCVHVENGVQCSKNATDNLDELCLTHPNNDGDEHRNLISNGHKGVLFYKALKERNWDTGRFVVEIRCRSHHGSLDRSGKKHRSYGRYGKLNLCYKNGKFNNRDWLKKKYETMTLQEIADECGVSLETIRHRMIRFNMLRRKPGRRKK